jgi:hypothetical protein
MGRSTAALETNRMLDKMRVRMFVLAFILAVFTDKSMQLHGWSKQLKV